MRLAHVLSSAGIASRRKAEDVIRAGRVTVNGSVQTDLAKPVDPAQDDIRVDGNTVRAAACVYYKLHKPVGYVSTVRDAHAEKCVVDLVPRHPHVVPVGRLDKDSSGLMIVTNDGDLAYRLTHPKFQHQKEYVVQVREFIPHDVPKKLERGVRLPEGIARADVVQRETAHRLRITLHEGRNRQIRRMLSNVHLTVEKLQRVREGKLRLGTLPVGKYEKITRNAIL